MTKATYGYYSDPGHGWLAVPVRVWQLSGAEISTYSYYSNRTQMVYLEEDCDAPAFIKAAGITSDQIREYTTNADSRIRRLPICGEAFNAAFPTNRKADA